MIEPNKISETKKWTDRLEPRFGYNMECSNMTNETALEIIEAIVFNVLADIEAEEEYSSVESMIERAMSRLTTLAESRKQ